MIVSSKQIYSHREERNLMIQNKDGVFIVRSRFYDVTKGHISKLSRLLSHTLRKKNLVYTL